MTFAFSLSQAITSALIQELVMAWLTPSLFQQQAEPVLQRIQWDTGKNSYNLRYHESKIDLEGAVPFDIYRQI